MNELDTQNVPEAVRLLPWWQNFRVEHEAMRNELAFYQTTEKGRIKARLSAAEGLLRTIWDSCIDEANIVVGQDDYLLEGWVDGGFTAKLRAFLKEAQP